MADADPAAVQTIIDLISPSGGAASTPVAIGIPLGVPGEVLICGAGAAKIGDSAQMPAQSDVGLLSQGQFPVDVHDVRIGHLGSGVAGSKGGVGAVASAATAPNVFVGAPTEGAGLLPKPPPWVSYICRALEVGGKGTLVEDLGKGCKLANDGTKIASGATPTDVVDNYGEVIASTAGSKLATAGTTAACLELTFASSLAATPLVGAAVGLSCVYVAKTGGSEAGKGLYKLLKDHAKKQAEADYQRALEQSYQSQAASALRSAGGDVSRFAGGMGAF